MVDDLVGGEIVECEYFPEFFMLQEGIRKDSVSHRLESRERFPLHRIFLLDEEFCIGQPKYTQSPSVKNQTFPQLFCVFSPGVVNSGFQSGVL